MREVLEESRCLLWVAVAAVVIAIVVHPNPAGCGGAQQPQDMTAPLHELSSVKHVIGVVSGKGGVGKSSVTSLMALTMARKGYKVGILDADITGPSIPKMFGIKEKAYADEVGMYPVKN